MQTSKLSSDMAFYTPSHTWCLPMSIWPSWDFRQTASLSLFLWDDGVVQMARIIQTDMRGRNAHHRPHTPFGQPFCGGINDGRQAFHGPAILRGEVNLLFRLRFRH